MKRSVFLTFGVVTVDLIIAVLMLGSMSNDWYLTFLSFQNYLLNVLFAIVGLYLSSYLFANKMEKVIKREGYLISVFIGIIGLFLILICGILSGSVVGLWEGISNVNESYTYGNAIEDYVQTPLILILVFGFIPTFLTGGFLGFLIKMDIK